MDKMFLRGLVALLLGVLACRPVFAVGWQEILLFGVLMTLLLGPPVYRFFRRLEIFRESRKKE